MMVWAKVQPPKVCNFSVKALPLKVRRQMATSALLLLHQRPLCRALKFFKKSTQQLCAMQATLPCVVQGFR